MMTTGTTTTTPPIPPTHVIGNQILLDPRQLQPSSNPRRKPVPAARITEIAESMRKFHVLEPLIVRLVGKGATTPPTSKSYQVVAGDTRQKAAIEAGLLEVPCILRELNDLDMLELQLIENVQRNDMHPVDEGEAFKRLIDGKKYTAESLAKTIGKSVRWVYNRLEFTKLIPEIRTAFLDEEITATHAELLARLTPAQQKEAFKDGLFHAAFDFDHLSKDQKQQRTAVSVRALQDWIAGNVRLPIESEVVQREFPEVREVIADATKRGPECRVLQVTRETYIYADSGKKLLAGVLLRDQWRAADSTKQRCEHVEKAVIVYGEDQGKVLLVCTDKACAKHWPELVARRAERAANAGTNGLDAATVKRHREKYQQQERARQQKAEAARKRFALLKPRLQQAALAVASKLTTVPAAVFAAMLARQRIKSCKPADLPRVMVQKTVGEVFRFAHGTYDLPNLTRWAKLLGINVAAIEKELQPKKAAAPPAKRKAKPAPSKIAGITKKQAAFVHALHAKTRKSAKRARKAGKKR